MRQVLVRCKASKAHDVVTYFGSAEKYKNYFKIHGINIYFVSKMQGI